MIIYIHGFASSGQGGKAKKFREYYQENRESFIAPSNKTLRL
ncbi:YqiA/YcfP family alpha/beta fold hydrolase [Sulfurimonas sp.]|nr:YqiA/YcfP family alpha/beta fold hydrolase [Sulfurimonas sp.]